MFYKTKADVQKEIEDLRTHIDFLSAYIKIGSDNNGVPLKEFKKEVRAYRIDKRRCSKKLAQLIKNS